MKEIIKKIIPILFILISIYQSAFALDYYPQFNEQKNPISVGKGEWKYFQLYTLWDKPHQVLIELTKLSDDLDFYIKEGALPTLNNYDLKSIQQGTRNENLIPTVTKGKTFYIGIYGYKAGTAIPQYLTIDSSSDPLLYSTYMFKGKKEWYYNTIEVTQNNTSIELLLTKLTGDLDLYISKDNYPTLNAYDQRSIKQGKRSENLNLSLNIGEKLYIGVYAFKTGAGQLKALYNGENPLIPLAKKECEGQDNTSSTVICSNEENRVYLLTKTLDNSNNVHSGFYEVSIEPNNEFVKVIEEDDSWIGQGQIVIDRAFVLNSSNKKLANTPIYRYDFTIDKGFEVEGSSSFYYRNQKILTFSFYSEQNHPNNLINYIDKMYTSQNGQKLHVEYNTIQDRYKKTYDISNPSEAILIDTIIIPRN